MILSILVSLSIMILNPVAQIQKGQDAQRQHDLKQLTTALDSYYNDKNYYPPILATLVGVKNIQAIPNDPTANSKFNYAYVFDGQGNNSQGITPQWNVLFAKLAFPFSSQSSFSCPLEQLSSCLPQNYKDLGYNYCVVSGNVNCAQIQGMTIFPLPIYNPSAVNTPTPIPGQFYCYCSEARFLLDPANGCLDVQPAGADTNSYVNRYCEINLASRSCIDPCTR